MRLLLGAALAFVAAAGLALVLAPGRDAAAPPTNGTASPVRIGATGERITYPPGRRPVLPLPGGGTRAVTSVLNIDHRLRFGDYVWNEEGVPAGPVWVRVDLADQMLSVFRDGQEIGATVILFGADGKPTPPGLYPVLERAEHHRSSLYDAEMPYMLRLTNDGVAIHASDVRAAAATHGCIGVPLAFARLLFGVVRRGDPVAILAS